MFSETAARPAQRVDGPVTVAEIAAFTARLRGGAHAEDPAGAVDLLRGLEDLKSTLCAVQADTAAGFDAARRAEQAAAGVPAARQGRGIAAEVALARRESPHRGQILLGMAKILTTEMPHTLARLRDGTLSEFRAMVLVRETACVDLEHRIRIDELLCTDPATLTGVGTGELANRARALVVELDPAGAVRRASNAAQDRHVTLRPAPDTMTYLTALMPVAQGVAAFAALARAAESARAAGDPRSKGQVMADTLAERLTRPLGTHAEANTAPTAGEVPAVPVGVNITLPATALAGGHDAATVHAPGVAPVVIPAELARTLIAAGLSDPTTATHSWYRRLYEHPDRHPNQHGQRLIAMTSRSRDFPPGLAEFLALRGQGICANAYCDAPVRHADHLDPVADGGETTADNGQGVCEACNHAKQAPGWRHQRDPHTGQVTTTTPTGHRHPAPPDTTWRRPPGMVYARFDYRLIA